MRFRRMCVGGPPDAPPPTESPTGTHQTLQTCYCHARLTLPRKEGVSAANFVDIQPVQEMPFPTTIPTSPGRMPDRRIPSASSIIGYGARITQSVSLWSPWIAKSGSYVGSGGQAVGQAESLHAFGNVKRRSCWKWGKSRVARLPSVRGSGLLL